MSQPSSSVPPTAVDLSALVRADAQSFQPGAAIVTEGEPGDCMYILLEGSVSVSSEGREIAVLGPGSLFGEMSVINDEMRPGRLRAPRATRLNVASDTLGTAPSDPPRSR